LSDNLLTGTVNLTFKSTSTIQVLRIDNNEFIGTVDLTSLGASVTQLDISNNAFTNSVNFALLPSTVEILYLQDNELSGTDTAFTSLPSSLIDFDISDNLFNASIDTVLNSIKKLSSIRNVILSYNEFHSTANLSYIPTSLQEFDMSSNNIVGISSWGALSQKNSMTLATLSVCDNLISQSWDPTDIPNSVSTLDICDNDFSGTLNFTSLPTSIAYFNASSNERLTGTVSFYNLPSDMASIDILNTGVEKPVIFTGMPDSSPILWMERTVSCDASTYCQSYQRSIQRYSTYCDSLSTCVATCHCLNNSIGTSVPTLKPTHKPTYCPTCPTPMPAPAPTKKTNILS